MDFRSLFIFQQVFSEFYWLVWAYAIFTRRMCKSICIIGKSAYCLAGGMMETTVLLKEAWPAVRHGGTHEKVHKAVPNLADEMICNATMVVDAASVVVQHNAAFLQIADSEQSFIGRAVPLKVGDRSAPHEWRARNAWLACEIETGNGGRNDVLVFAEPFAILGHDATLLRFKPLHNKAKGGRLPSGEAFELARNMGLTATSTALAHELNQPLTALILYLQSLQRLMKGTPDQSAVIQGRELSAKAAREAQRASDIIKRVRSLAQRREPQRITVNFDSIVDEAVETALAGRVNTPQLMRDYGDVGRIRIDAVQIQQIVINLVANACDALAGNRSGAVKIQTKRIGDQVELAIGDNGPGIPPHAMAQLFKAFSTTKTGGIGLGLSISQAIAQGHGGDLTVDPYRTGDGACFRLKLPIEASSGEFTRAFAGENPDPRHPIGQEINK
jgi:signal transduction histidine kinase